MAWGRKKNQPEVPIRPKGSLVGVKALGSGQHADVSIVSLVRINDYWCINNRVDLTKPGTNVWYLVQFPQIQHHVLTVRIVTDKESFYKCVKVSSEYDAEFDPLYSIQSGGKIGRYVVDMILAAIAKFDQNVSA